MKNNLSDKEKENLVKELCQTISKLKEAGIIRDNRSIIGNLGEYQCAKRCNLKLEKRTNERYFDAKTKNGKKVQIKTLHFPRNSGHTERLDLQYNHITLGGVRWNRAEGIGDMIGSSKKKQ